MRGFTTILVIPVLVTACSMQEIADTNKKISDGASGIMNSLRGNSNTSDNSMKPMTLPQSLKKESKSKGYIVAVDVDSAAARIKRHYKFMSSQELDSLRNSSNDGEWKAAAEDYAHPVWEAMPGSYYKMGSDWNDNDHLDVEIEKNGSGSKLYITYYSASSERLSGSGVQKLMKEIHSVALGE
ncbi:hypothetical protein [Klebsiella pneumoniae]|uniref:hypothetical protein n=1 Tax=Klebsiella pneumoniae TaxID=573 RepID=UPI00391925FD